MSRKRSKRYKKQVESLKNEELGLTEAVEKVKSFDKAGFDQSVECVLNLGIDPKKSDQIVRGAVPLPHGIGKTKKVVAFCQEDEIEKAKQAGAVEAGGEDLVEKIENGWTDFDVAIASPRLMRYVGKLGRILGPHGKMPTPKNGTVTDDVVTAVKEFAAGKVEFRNDSGGNVHVVVGKQSFDEKKLAGNINAFISHIRKIRPSSAKGVYIRKMYLCGTMTPAVKVRI